jgi:hypothetical protein
LTPRPNGATFDLGHKGSAAAPYVGEEDEMKLQTRRTTKLAALVLPLLCAALIGAGSAHAAPPHVLVVGYEDIAFDAPTPECPIFSVTFTVVSVSGERLGTGTSCVQRISGNCDPLRIGCRQTVDTVFTFNLDEGSITVRTVLREFGTSENSLFEVASGRITSATEAFAGKGGALVGAGSLTFNPDGTVESTLVHVLIVR